MKTQNLLLHPPSLILFAGLLAAAVPALAAGNPIILPVDDPEAAETHRVIWATESGIHYDLRQSTDLVHWTTVDGFPIKGDGSIVEHAFATGTGRLFFRVRKLGPPPSGFSFIPAGIFTMGSPDDEPGRFSSEGPQHQVTLTRSFYLGQTPVTWAQWNEVRDWAMASGLGYDMAAGQKGSHGDSRNTDGDPVTMVNWHDVVKWLNAKSEKEGIPAVYRVGGQIYRAGERDDVVCDFDATGYRLPTEAEWEYAARAGTTTAFYNGPITHPDSSPVDPNLDAIGWYWGNSGGQTWPVGQKEPNSWGLHDMSGHVMEWCWDWSRRTYTTSAATDPTGPSTGTLKVFRGGSFGSGARACRSAYRGGTDQVNRFLDSGFRPARTAVP